MKCFTISGRRAEFEIIAATRGVQAASMLLPPGGASDDRPSNEHPRSEQWLFVISGSGEAIVGSGRSRRKTKLRKNSLLVINRRELHQIKNTGVRPLRTINFYVPPAYDADGEPKSSKS